MGSRKRFLIQSDGSKIWLIIRRLNCPHCNRIHHELPDMVIPYKRYSTQAVEDILSGAASTPLPVACENSTIRRIRIWFSLLRSYFESCLQSLKQLFQTDADFLIEIDKMVPLEVVTLPAGWLRCLVRALVNSGRWRQTRSAC
ncbi:MAG: hypothetical protein IJV12_00625 [Acidaminococcaceae bacterium]|nr:hypothetical protein [Acidaminococcaceae bacterium]